MASKRPYTITESKEELIVTIPPWRYRFGFILLVLPAYFDFSPRIAKFIEYVLVQQRWDMHILIFGSLSLCFVLVTIWGVAAMFSNRYVIFNGDAITIRGFLSKKHLPIERVGKLSVAESLRVSKLDGGWLALYHLINRFEKAKSFAVIGNNQKEIFILRASKEKMDELITRIGTKFPEIVSH